MRWKLRELPVRDALLIGLPLALLVGIGFWAAAQFIQPAPPHHFIIATGPESGAYQIFAARYKQLLAEHDITVVEKPSNGAVQNIEWLMDRNVKVDAGFVQGGLGVGKASDGLQSLGSFYYEPLWVFYRSDAELTHIGELAGKRIAVGPEGSGTRKLALGLLEANGIEAAPTVLEPIGGMAVVEALRTGQVDAAFVVGTANSGAVWSLFYTEGVKLMSLARADAYVRLLPYLTKLTLPEGAIDLKRGIPPHDVNLVAPMATIVVRKEAHPALIDLLLSAAEEVHGEPGLFQRAGEFPNAKQVDFPLSKEADRHYKSGRPFLQRYLPFWAATLVDRMIVLIIPLFALLLPAMKVLPALYAWRVRSRIYRWYGELKFLEREVEEDAGHRPQTEWLERLDRIEAHVNRVKTPLAYANELYMLREHINLVRRAVERRAGAGA